ncbi:hypothetical protein CsSME_00002466 [Camellia sinensis var. sinensis]
MHTLFSANMPRTNPLLEVLGFEALCTRISAENRPFCLLHSQKIERLRLDREKTEKMLRERHLVMETNLKEMVKRGEVQKLLEIEVDRLFRLKELKSSCMVRKCLFGYSENASFAEEKG